MNHVYVYVSFFLALKIWVFISFIFLKTIFASNWIWNRSYCQAERVIKFVLAQKLIIAVVVRRKQVGNRTTTRISKPTTHFFNFLISNCSILCLWLTLTFCCWCCCYYYYYDDYSTLRTKANMIFQSCCLQTKITKNNKKFVNKPKLYFPSFRIILVRKNQRHSKQKLQQKQRIASDCLCSI